MGSCRLGIRQAARQFTVISIGRLVGSCPAEHSERPLVGVVRQRGTVRELEGAAISKPSEPTSARIRFRASPFNIGCAVIVWTLNPQRKAALHNEKLTGKMIPLSRMPSASAFPCRCQPRRLGSRGRCVPRTAHEPSQPDSHSHPGSPGVPLPVACLLRMIVDLSGGGGRSDKTQVRRAGEFLSRCRRSGVLPALTSGISSSWLPALWP